MPWGHVLVPGMATSWASRTRRFRVLRDVAGSTLAMVHSTAPCTDTHRARPPHAEVLWLTG
eukprot:scaffold124337_cov66-Phaeocystis_antarctica.AAC.1